jgi:hypothetical protein
MRRRTLLKLLQVREGFHRSLRETTVAHVDGVSTMRKFELAPWKPPSDKAGQERLFW